MNEANDTRDVAGECVCNYKRVTVWGKPNYVHWDFHTLEEALDLINKDERLKDNFCLECVTCKFC